MLRHPLTPRISPGARRGARFVALIALVLGVLGPAALPVSAAGGPTMEARILVGGHARVGSWVAISVHLTNDGPPISAELRLAGGTQGQTHFGTPVDLPTQADKTYVVYAQPPAFGSELTVDLVEGGTTLATRKAPFTIHDATQLVVAVVAEHPERLVGSIDLPPNMNQVAPLIVSLTPEDLPERVEAWASIDRMVWQDTETDRLSPAQLDAMRGWLAGGGRLVIAGGTVGPAALAAFPDTILPFRPVVTTDLPAENLTGLLGELPTGAATVPALSGELIAGRTLATAGDRVVAAERPYGSGGVTLLGFDPSVDWISRSDASHDLWRRILPAKGAGGLSFVDDNLLISAVSQLPALSLPPIGGLILILLVYILLIGPINYLVLVRLDRREWAWFTMPALIVAFAVGAYGFGAALRGSSVVVNEVAVVRGASGTTDGTAQVYLGVFSPTRGVYQVSVPGGALLSAPISGDFFGTTGTANTLDVLQGDPARVRDLGVGFSSLRAIRAETAMKVPLIETDLRLEDGRLKGTVKNSSQQRLERPAVVLGQTVVSVGDLEPGATATVDAPTTFVQFGQSMSDKVVGQGVFGEIGTTPGATRQYVRHNMIDELTYDPQSQPSNVLPGDGAVVLAWGSDPLLDVTVEGQKPEHLGNVLYYVPTDVTIHGKNTFRADLLGSTVVGTDSQMFSRDPTMISFGRGNATLAYRPIGFDGRFTASELVITMNGDPSGGAEPVAIEPLASNPPACPDLPVDPATGVSSAPPSKECQSFLNDGLAEVELFDLEGQAWRRLPHFTAGTRYAVGDPARYVDPTSGTVLIRYINDRSDQVGVQVDVALTGTVE
ncbi:MAG: hypothetical protein ACJ78L_05070 [Chloroflexota bacterium]